MNLLTFVQKHNGLVAARYDWELVFGKELGRFPQSTKRPEPTGQQVFTILDNLRDGQFCKVEPQSRFYHNPNYAEAELRQLTSLSQIEALRMPAKGFCLAVARALGLDVHGVQVQGEDDQMHLLFSSDTPVYLCMSTRFTEVKTQMERLAGSGKVTYLLTLFDWTKKLPAARCDKVHVVPLEHYIDTNTPAHELRSRPGVSFMAALSARTGPVSDVALIRRPTDDANYQRLMVVLHTTSKDTREIPNEDMIECWYVGGQRARRKAKDIGLFLTKAGTFNVQWKLFRRYALGNGFIYSAAEEKNSDSTTRWELKKILNALFDQPQIARPFAQTTKHGGKVNFLLRTVEVNPSVPLDNRYVTRSLDDEGSRAYLQSLGILS